MNNKVSIGADVPEVALPERIDLQDVPNLSDSVRVEIQNLLFAANFVYHTHASAPWIAKDAEGSSAPEDDGFYNLLDAAIIERLKELTGASEIVASPEPSRTMHLRYPDGTKYEVQIPERQYTVDHLRKVFQDRSTTAQMQ